MQRRMHAHQPVAPVPVDVLNQFLTNGRLCLIRSRNENDLGLGIAGDCACDLDLVAVLALEKAGVATVRSTAEIGSKMQEILG